MQLKSEKEAAHLRSLGDEQERLAHVQEVIEDQYLAGDEQFAAANLRAGSCRFSFGIWVLAFF